MPTVSIIMPAHTMEPWISATLRSVQAQSLSDWECLVIDDGSTDATASCVNAFGDSRIRCISQAKSGVSAARNRGLAESCGDYVAFLDADDIWQPRALELLVRALQAQPEAALAWADFIRFDDASRRILPQPATRLQHTGNAWHDMLVDIFMHLGAICVRSAVAKDYTFATSIRIGEDRDWLLRVLRQHKAVYAPHTVMYYRQRAGSAVRDYAQFLRDERTLMQSHLADATIPSTIRQRSLSALDFHAAVLAAKEKQWSKVLGLYCKAVQRDPWYVENYLRPLRKAWFLLRPPTFLAPENCP